MSRVPRIRFKGFEEDWEQRKLGEVAIFNPKSKLPSTFEYVDLESVIGTEIVSHSTETINTAPSRAQRLAKKGDIFYQTVRPYQKNNYLFEKYRGNYVFSTGYAQLRPFVNERFLFYLIQNGNFVNMVLYNCTGTSYPAINSSDLRRIDIYLSRNSTEQKCIGNTIKTIDHLITLHQRKLEKLKIIKKSMLENLFPQNGEKTPKIRFSGFTEDWEQRKTSELFKITRGYVLAANITDGNKSGDNPYPVYSSQTKDNGLMGYYKDYLYENAITWTTDGANAGTVNYRDEKFYCTNVCGVLLGDKVTPNQMLAEAINNVAKSYVSYVGNPKLMNNVMAEICIWLPSEDTERKAISSFVYSLDYLITLHQSKLDKLQKIKKSMLESMFV